MKTAYIGFMTDVHSNWRTFCPPLFAPSNYKDPLKIQEWMDRATERQTKEAKDKPLTGRISEFYLLESPRPDHVGLPPVIDKGAMNWPNQTALEIVSLYDRIFVLNAGVFAVLARMEHLDVHGQISQDFNWIITSRLSHVPLIYSSPQTAPRLFDPIDLLVSSTAEENCNPEAVMHRLTGQTLAIAQGRTANERALTAFEVAKRLGA